MGGRLAALVVLGAWLVAEPVVADDRAAAVVLAFSGPSGSTVRVRVVRVLSSRVKLVPRARVEAVARELDVHLGRPEGRARVAAELGLTFLVAGEVEAVGSVRRARLHAYDARGESIAERVIASPFDSTGRRRLADATRRLVRDALAHTPPPTNAPASADVLSPDDVAPVTSASPSDAVAVASEDAERLPDPPPDPIARAPVLRLLAGVGARARLVQIPLVAGGVRRFESGLFLEVPVRMELRLRSAARRGTAGFVLRGDFATSSWIVATSGGGNERATSAFRGGVHVGYDRLLAHGMVGGYAGFVYEAFEPGADAFFPSSRIPLARVALVGRVDFVGPALGLDVEVAYRYLFDLGELATSFGEDSDGVGFDAWLGFGGSISVFAYSLRVGYEVSYLSFAGDATDQPARGGTDQGATMTAQIGVNL